MTEEGEEEDLQGVDLQVRTLPVVDFCILQPQMTFDPTTVVKFDPLAPAIISVIDNWHFVKFN